MLLDLRNIPRLNLLQTGDIDFDPQVAFRGLLKCVSERFGGFFAWNFSFAPSGVYCGGQESVCATGEGFLGSRKCLYLILDAHRTNLALKLQAKESQRTSEI